MLSKVLFSSISQHYETPIALYEELDRQFHFNDDPCSIGNGIDGLLRSWGSSTYVNPPYGRNIDKWIMKAYQESQLGKVVVCLIASRTDTKWWHDYAMKATEIRFLRGRLKFGGAKGNAPFPSCILVFDGKCTLLKDKPPLLSDEEIKKLGWGWMLNYDYELRDVLQAQREIDIKYYLT